MSSVQETDQPVAAEIAALQLMVERGIPEGFAIQVVTELSKNGMLRSPFSVPEGNGHPSVTKAGALRDTAVPLLKEYSDKCRDLISRAQALPPFLGMIGDQKPKFQAIREGLHREATNLLPPCRVLAQRVSQAISHGRLDDWVKVELQLRLAEFEAILLTLGSFPF